MLQRLAVPVRPGKTDGAPRPGGKAWLGVCWSLTEVVLTVSTSGKTGSSSENANVFFSQDQQVAAHQAQEGWGGCGRVFRGSCSRVWELQFSRRTFNSPRLLEEDTRVLVEGLVVLKGDLTTASTERSLFFDLLGGEVACCP